MEEAVADAERRGLDPELSRLVLTAIVEERRRILQAVMALPPCSCPGALGATVSRAEVAAIVNARMTA